MTDIFFKKLLDFKHADQELQFGVAQDLFSSHQIDIGTTRLLRSLPQAALSNTKKILDLGCGYGPLGLTLKKMDPQRCVHMVDRDALAVDYAGQNAERNHFPDVEAYGSIGYDDVTDNDFDLIISNIPGKANDAAIEDFLLNARNHLTPQGWVALVIVAPLAEFVAEILDHPDIQVTFAETRSGHAVFHYHFLTPAKERAAQEKSSFARGIYNRDSLSIEIDALEFTIETAYGLYEFDTLNYQTTTILKTLINWDPDKVTHAIVLNPGQGVIPVTLWTLFEPQSLTMASRDLLSLRNTERNLAMLDCRATQMHSHHIKDLGITVENKADLIVAGVAKKNSPEITMQILSQAADLLTPQGAFLLTSSSTAITRLVKHIESEKVFRIKKRKRKKGQSLLILEKRS